jgi:hypothetical protein
LDQWRCRAVYSGNTVADFLLYPDPAIAPKHHPGDRMQTADALNRDRLVLLEGCKQSAKRFCTNEEHARFMDSRLEAGFRFRSRNRHFVVIARLGLFAIGC